MLAKSCIVCVSVCRVRVYSHNDVGDSKDYGFMFLTPSPIAPTPPLLPVTVTVNNSLRILRYLAVRPQVPHCPYSCTSLFVLGHLIVRTQAPHCPDSGTSLSVLGYLTVRSHAPHRLYSCTSSSVLRHLTVLTRAFHSPYSATSQSVLGDLIFRTHVPHTPNSGTSKHLVHTQEAHNPYGPSTTFSKMASEIVDTIDLQSPPHTF